MPEVRRLLPIGVQVSFLQWKRMFDLFDTPPAMSQISAHEGRIDCAGLRFFIRQLSPPVGLGSRAGAFNPFLSHAKKN